MRLVARALAAVVALVTAGSAVVGAAVPASAEGIPAQVGLRPLSTSGAAVSGPFTVTADVTMNASTSVSVELRTSLVRTPVWAGKYPTLEPQTVTAQDCPQTCTLTWSVDPTTRDVAWPDGTVNVGGSFYEGQTHLGYVNVLRAPYRTTVAPLTLDLAYERVQSDVVRDYAADVLDTGGVLKASSTQPRTAGETLHASVKARRGTVEVAAAGEWGPADPGTGVTPGRLSLDTAALPEGDYEVYVQARNAKGEWGQSFYAPLTVRHEPVASWWKVEPIVAGSPATVGVTVRYPWASGGSPASISVRVDGGESLVLQTPFHGDSWGPWVATVSVPAEKLPAGTRTLTTQVLDIYGAPISSPRSVQLPVLTFTETVTFSPLVVGQQVPVTVKGTAPGGLTYSSCDFAFYDPAGANNTAGGIVCWYQKSFTTTTTPTPRVAGAGRFELQPETTTGLKPPLRTIPVTIYAARSATLSAPTSAAYGTRLSATVTVTDRNDVAKPVTAAAGVLVTLQRKTAGTTTWASVASVRTDAYGKAVVPFTNIANARLRAVVPNTVPGKYVVTAERAITSRSTVAWSSLPTSVTSGATVYAAVYAKPYESGAVARVQARRLGTSTWTTFASAAVTSTGYVRPSARLYTRGTWEVRVQRVATTRQAAGYSTVKRLSVR